MKIVLMSDTHTDRQSVFRIRDSYPDADYVVHCGDILMPPEILEGITAVAGNCDLPGYLPFEQTIEAGSFRILVKHGHDLFRGYAPDYRNVARYAKQHGYNAVFFGHSHMYYDDTIDGIRLLNPGSVSRSRDFEPGSYMIVTIEGDTLKAERKNAVELMFK